MSKKYPVTIQTHLKRIENSKLPIKTPAFTRFLKIIGVQNRLPIPFRKALIHIKILKVIVIPHPTHTNFENIIGGEGIQFGVGLEI